MYEVGDKVVIRKDLSTGVWYGTNNAVPEMVELRGLMATITRVKPVPYTEYSIDLDKGYWEWTPEMFEKRSE